MLLKEAYHQLQSALSSIYEQREAANIADWIIEEITNWTKSQRIVHNDYHLSPTQEIQYLDYKKELLSGKPVQYVLGYTWFMGKRFMVNEHVLIPRPETEELVNNIIDKQHSDKTTTISPFKALDIGTGSGCIAISLQLAFPTWEIWGIDKSTSALAVARQNALDLHAAINFKEADILTDPPIDHLPVFDMIVSNPPYIPHEDKHDMTNQVLDHEPHLALFVTNKDPLQFYKSIVAFSEHHLVRGGMLWFETHMNYAESVASLLKENDYIEVTVKKDFQGKDRIVSGKRSGASL